MLIYKVTLNQRKERERVIKEINCITRLESSPVAYGLVISRMLFKRLSSRFMVYGNSLGELDAQLTVQNHKSFLVVSAEQ